MACPIAPSYDYLLNLFRSVDTDGSGAISVMELQRALSRGFNRAFNGRTVELLMQTVDRNRSGTISMDEFGELWKILQRYRSVFLRFDRDNSGDIDRCELRNALLALDFKICGHEVVQYLNSYDSTRTGALSFDDFVQVCIEVSRRCAVHYPAYNSCGPRLF